MLNQVFKVYLRHNLVIALFVFAFIMLIVCLKLGIFFHYAWLAILPIAIAPFYEWYTHKFVLHAKLSTKYLAIRKFQIRLHHQHHRIPNNVKHQFAPTLAVAVHLIQTYLLFSLLCWSFKISLMPFTFGVLYYLFYEWIHLAHHTPKYRPYTQIGKNLKRAHMSHHFHNENYCWGITNYLGDRCLNTFKDLKQTPKSSTTKTIAGYTDGSTNEVEKLNQKPI